ncbi:unnamed protein product [Phaedon cochleariae]|uniref:Uncharacterized protein n=1 Tax=Phaedon cochleariae TaxID=80249 RepID=A0A9P0GRN3_PHACE|nr:unnamed protein product [Phaedon cochleariae]
MTLINNVLLCILFAVNLNFCFCITRVYFSKCAVGGFTCTVRPVSRNISFLNLTYQCPSGVDDVLIMINQFSSPTNAESLLIQNCRRLTISVRCSSERKLIRSVHIRNIGTLSIQRLPFHSHLPQEVALENIGYIEDIPSFTFSQIDKSVYTTGCVLPRDDFRTISLKNLKIDTVQSNGFYVPNGFGNITFTNVTINRLQSSAVVAKIKKSGEFLMEKSTVEVAEHLALRLFTEKATFKQSSFVEISSGGINGTIESLYFMNNSVNALQPHAFSIFSGKVQISHNRFEYLKSGSLEKISPGMMETSNLNFGKLKFDYEFTGNAINFMDAGCLHPDTEAYENVASDIVFQENVVLCSCDNSAWIFSQIGHGYNTALLRSFYESILDPASKNTCSSYCELPISFSRNMIEDGNCFENVTTEKLCEMNDNDTSKNTSALSSSLNELEEIVIMGSMLPMSSTGGIISFFCVQVFIFSGILILNL